MNLADQTRVRIGKSYAALAVGAASTGVVVLIALGHFDLLVQTHALDFAIAAVGFGLLTWLLIGTQGRNGAVWALAWGAVFSALVSTGVALAVVLSRGSISNLTYDVLREVTPAQLSRPAAWAIHLRFWAVVPALWLPFTLGLLLFPNGHPPTRRWKWVGWWSVAAIATATVATALIQNPWSTHRIRAAENSIEGTVGTINDYAFLLASLSAVVSVASLIVRYRRSEEVDTRNQIRWIAIGASLSVIAFLVLSAFDKPGPADLFNALISLVLMTLLIGSYGLAITKHRLYGIDVIVSKSVTYLSLAAAITLLYGAVVVVPLLVIGRSEDGGPGLILPLVATAIVAVLFEPIRSRLRRWADRLVYGDRTTPHEVLSQVTAQLSKASDSGTNDLARLVAQGTGAEYAVVWLRSMDMLHPEGVWPIDAALEFEPIPDGSMVDDELTQSRPVSHGEERFGALTITKPRNDPITPRDSELLADVAAGAGLLLRNINLNRELEERARQVRESRRRLIVAHDTERHRLERNLHDGAQQQVVALKVKLGVAKAIAEREGVEEIIARVADLADDTQRAVDALRAVAQGIYPPLLESEGLGAALRAVGRSSTMATIESAGLVRYPPEVEAAAYFCVLEATEQARMSGATFIRADVRDIAGQLMIDIEHDGNPKTLDLATVADRIDALGGRIEIEGTSSGALRITSRVPTPVAV